MIERFTDHARKAVSLANQEALRLNHEYIGTEHILLGLVKEGQGVAATVLRKMHVDLKKIITEVEKIRQRETNTPRTGKLPYTYGAKKAIELAFEEGQSLRHNYVGTGHLLLGLLGEQGGVAADMLADLGVKLEAVREEVRTSADEERGPTPFGPRAKEAVASLINALGGPDAELRRSVAMMLGHMGLEAKEAIPSLINALGDPDGMVQVTAAWALRQIDPAAKEAVPAIIKALGDSDAEVRAIAARALGGIDPARKEALAALIQSLGDPDHRVRRDAAGALRNIGREAKEAVPNLVKVLGDSDAYVRAGAVCALGRIGSGAKESIPALIEVLGDRVVWVRCSAIWALGEIGPEAKEAVPALTNALGDADADLRCEAVCALGHIGPEAKQAIAELERLAEKDPSVDVRRSAQGALEKIRK